MLTVEELVIESLYHRLVLVNVKKQGTENSTGHASGFRGGTGPCNHDDEIDSDVDEGRSVDDPGAAGDGAGASSNSADSPGGSTSQSHGGGPSTSSSSSPGGLGFLVVNAMNPFLRRAYGLTPTYKLNHNLVPALKSPQDTDRDLQTDPENTQTAEELLEQQGIEITEDIQMILNTGEIQLMKTTLRSPDLQVDLPPTWAFGASLSHDLSPQTPEEQEEKQSRSLLPRGVSLDNCNQFSVVKLQDKRDPSGRSLVLVQTNDGSSRPDSIEAPSRRQALRGAKLRKVKSMSDAEPAAQNHSQATKPEKRTYVTPVPCPAITSNAMAVFVEQHEEGEEEEGKDGQTAAEREHEPRAGQDCVTRTQDNEIDSGIWDMIHGAESRLSTRESTPVVAATATKGAHGDRVSDSDGEVDAECGKDVQEPFRMTASYKLFSVSENMECKVTPIGQLARDRVAMVTHDAKEAIQASLASKQSSSCQGDSVQSSPHINHTENRSNLHQNPVSSQNCDLPSLQSGPCIKPTAEITFQIETSETESESTVSSITDIRCEFGGSIPSSPMKAVTANSSPAKSLPNDEQISPLLEIEEVPEPEEEELEFRTPPSYSDFELAQMRQSDVQANDVVEEIQDHNYLHQTNGFQGDFANQSLPCSANHSRQPQSQSTALKKHTSSELGRPVESYKTSSPKVYRKSETEPCRMESPIPNYETPPMRRCPKEGAAKTGAESPTYRVRSPRGSLSHPSHYYRSPAQSPATRRRPGSLETTFSPAPSPPLSRDPRNQVYVEYPPDHSTYGTRPRPMSDPTNDSGISVALRPPSRIITYRDPMSPDSEMSDSCMFTESSEGEDGSVYELDLNYDIPQYSRHPDWMAQLPENLHHQPITHLVIPGSHISLAIDRDMRMDMDFSKCNYEMAEFLRKLPNLAIFNNFRGLMKKIWKAWMPKQTLSIPQQLDAGVRYLDLRITKLRGALYGEHGLYTRQLKRYLKEVREFLEAHTKEVVILHFQALTQLDRSDKRHLVTTLFQTFGARLARSGVPGSTTLDFLWKNKKQVIVMFPDEDMSLLQNHIFYGLVWPDFEIEAPMPRKQHIEELVEHLRGIDADNSPPMKAIADKKMFVLKAVLSPDMTMVFGEYKYQSMRELTQVETEVAVLDWVRRQESPPGRCNIVALDYVGTGTAVSEILQLNFPHRETVV